MTDLVESIRQRVLATPDTPAPLSIAVKAEMPWLEPEEISDRAEDLYADFYQLGALTPLMEDPMLTDILVNGASEVWVVSDGPPQRAPIAFASDAAVRTLAVRLAALAGRLLDDAHPFVDFEFNGLRIHAVLPPLSRSGTLLSIRRRRAANNTLAQLVRSQEALALLNQMLRDRQNFLISGGTGSGKTTLLSALLNSLPPQERIVIVEDTAEIDPHHPHAISLQARSANGEGRGEVSMRDLVRQSLRMRPDRIIVGEVRGAEVIDLLAALNTGHAGSGGTIHAREGDEVPSRIEALSVFAGIPADAAHSLLLSSIDVVIHLKSAREGRGVQSISKILRSGNRAVLVPEYLASS
jgi:pilus assembly protein CpaF